MAQPLRYQIKESISDIIKLKDLLRSRTIRRGEDNTLYFKASDALKIIFPRGVYKNTSKRLDCITGSDKMYYKTPNTMGRPSLYCNLKGLILVILNNNYPVSKKLQVAVSEIIRRILNDGYYIDPNITPDQLKMLQETINDLSNQIS